MLDESVVLEITADRVHVECAGVSLTLVGLDADVVKRAVAEEVLRFAAHVPIERRRREEMERDQARFQNNQGYTLAQQQAPSGIGTSGLSSAFNRY